MCDFVRTGFMCGAFALCATVGVAQERTDRTDARRGVFQTAVAAADLDAGALSEWTGGRAMTPANAVKLASELVWTHDARQRGAYGYEFGKTKNLGIRHLRMGFARPIPIGAILTVGNVRVSVLRAEASYPGNPADDAQWLSAQRMIDGCVTSDEANAREACALWTLPPGTQSRAVRFTHTASVAADVTGEGLYAGFLGGVYVVPERVANIAPLAVALARNSSDKAVRLNNGSRDNYWTGWENINGDNPDSLAAAKRIEDDPEWVVLVWPQPVALRGLAFLLPYFCSADIQMYKGPEGTHPRDAGESDWETLTRLSGLRTLYPLGLPVSWLDFEKTVTTRAVRVRMTSPFVEDADVENREHGHTRGRSKGGKRVELCELLALQALGQRALETALPSVSANDDEPVAGVPVTFTLPEDGFVTLVIEDLKGMRIRNLVSETPFKKGKNVIGWDGMDDVGRDFDAAHHGLYHIPEHPVVPGDYRVRGLWRKAISCRYEFSVYSNGNPPWPTRDHTGAWLANHTPPQSALFVPAEKSPTGEPAVFLGAYITEGPDGLIWVDLEGNKKGGKRWIGGNWTAAPFLARDDGPNADPKIRVYVAAVGSVDAGAKKKAPELRITALTEGQDKPILLSVFDQTPDAGARRADAGFENELGGLAAFNNIVVCSLTLKNQVLFIDAKLGQRMKTVSVAQPRGLVFDSKGRLWVVSGKRIVCFEQTDHPQEPNVVVASGLEDPQGITLDSDGSVYVSDYGHSHQVKVFTAQGRFIRAIGRPGAPKSGPYDPLHMNHPQGIAVDSKQQLWVAEQDFLPKRVSVWTTDGAFVKAFYGPPKYGGGGALDPEDRNCFYYAEETRGLMAFTLDWKTGTSHVASVLDRSDVSEPDAPERPWDGCARPQVAFYRDTRKLFSFGKKQRFFTNSYNGNPTGGASPALIFGVFDGLLRPVAAAGYANACALFKSDAFKPFWPKGVKVDTKDPWRDDGKDMAFFIWSDLNGDGQVQTNEVMFRQGKSGGVTVAPDFSINVAYIGDQAMRFTPVRFTAQGVPVYDLSHGQVLAEGVIPPKTSGGSQVLVDPSGNTVITLGVKPFLNGSLCGGKKGRMTWCYPSLWPGLHASHEAPKPESLGELIGTTRLLGDFVNPKGSEVGPLWCINGNMGNVYLFTSDGLFVATLFEDSRVGDAWQMPVEQRGMSLKGVSPGDEHFWPTITQSSDGQIYLVYNKDACSLVKIEGLESLRQVSADTVSVTSADLEKIHACRVAREEKRKREQGGGRMTVVLQSRAPKVDGSLDEWNGAPWVEIEKRGVGAYFDSKSKPYDIRGAVVVAEGKLFAAWRTGNSELLKNSGEMPIALFKTGGTLELMLGTNPDADAQRRTPVAGDLRLLITQVKGQTKALIYRPVAPGALANQKVPFSSPARTFIFDQVEEVSGNVELAADGKGNYEISIPLDVLGLTPQPGMKIRGDIGILRGDGSQTLSRVYWGNKATGIVSDIPSEAELLPSLWGLWEFSKPTN